MELYCNKYGEIACPPPPPTATVADLADAAARFCARHIDCPACTGTCCAGFIVYADNVFASNLAQALLPAALAEAKPNLPLRVLRLDRQTGKWYVPPRPDGKCIFLTRQSRCAIYAHRPLVCRMHICRKSGAAYSAMKENLYFAYQEALGAQMRALAANSDITPPDYWAYTNPLTGMTSYDACIAAILQWSHETKINQALACR